MKKSKKPFNNPKTDPDGSWTGNFQNSEKLETPVQDADDL